jgi:hypothetical protein
MDSQSSPIDDDATVNYSKQLELLAQSEDPGPTLKHILEGGKGRIQSFEDATSAFLRQKKGENEELCAANYKNFVASIEQIFVTRKELESLKGKVLAIDADTQRLGEDVIEMAESMIAHQRTRDNCENSLSVLEKGRKAILVCEAAHDHVVQGSFHEALKELDSLGPLLAELCSFDFSRQIEDMAEALRKEIFQMTQESFKEWLVATRNIEPQVGRQLLLRSEREWKAAEEMIERHRALSLSLQRGGGLQIDQIIPALMKMPKSLREASAHDAPEALDLRPLHYAIHIFAMLRKTEWFLRFYLDTREQQALLSLQVRGCCARRSPLPTRTRALPDASAPRWFVRKQRQRSSSPQRLFRGTRGTQGLLRGTQARSASGHPQRLVRRVAGKGGGLLHRGDARGALHGDRCRGATDAPTLGAYDLAAGRAHDAEGKRVQPRATRAGQGLS